MLAVTLDRHDFREYDQVIVLYTKERGKVEAIARGIKKITAKNSAALEPFALLEVEIIPGKEVRYVGAVETVTVFRNIHAYLDRSLIAKSALATVHTLISGQEKDERIFKLIVDFLEYLNAVAPNKDSLDRFVVELIGCLGFSPTGSASAHADILKHVRYYTGLPIADWNNYQAWLS